MLPKEKRCQSSPVLRSILWDFALDVVLVEDLTPGAAQLLDLLAEEAGDVLLAVGGVGEAGVSIGLKGKDVRGQRLQIEGKNCLACPLGPRDSVEGQEKPSISSEKIIEMVLLYTVYGEPLCMFSRFFSAEWTGPHA